MTSRENYEWHKARIREAENFVELNEAAVDIAYDKWEQEPWTKNEDWLNELKNEYKEKSNGFGDKQDRGLSTERRPLGSAGKSS
tara:strand:- start:136 stop:387 length:252 start_codon:yes stop_codon:yes gene_type:complete